eukprot:TRINITY_DN5318_c0_g1_i1.p1 TRINITY_DN5318_c0_g1~~TRINITY_DN5318_c0_g1_i1.p1  ORF type:complete len:587 (+),score=141.84 TRINITY_DN5318_c0_g1_i1:66-1826(+)
MGLRCSAFESEASSSLARPRRLNSLLAMYDKNKSPVDNLLKLLIILAQEFKAASGQDVGSSAFKSKVADAAAAAAAAAASKASLGSSSSSGSQASLFGTSAHHTANSREREVQKIAGFGYSGTQEDAKRRKILTTQKLLERFQQDQSVTSCVQAVMHVLNAHHTDKDVIELWNTCLVFNSIAYYFFQEAPASQMVEERWVLFYPLLQACQRIATRPHLRASLRASNNIISQIADIKQQLELLVQIQVDPSKSSDSDLSQIAIFSCRFILDQVADEMHSEQKKAQPDGSVQSWYEEKVIILKNGKLEFVDLTGEPFIFESDFQASANEQPSKARLGRLRKEFATMHNALPDGVYVRIHQDRFDKIKVMIAGPVDTPYENGLFIFDVFLPAEYPSIPPKMKICTTGGGQFRFNPNLYTNGKVCLSLLGTWSGPGWDPTESTILQLLISVQAMILVEFPFENEPGYENQRLSRNSLSYNCGIRHATVLYAMSWQLERGNNAHSPPACFHEVIDAHFCVNRERILKQLDLWQLTVEENRGTDNNYFAWTKLFPNGAWKKNRGILEAQLSTLVPELASSSSSSSATRKLVL